MRKFKFGWSARNTDKHSANAPGGTSATLDQAEQVPSGEGGGGLRVQEASYDIIAASPGSSCKVKATTSAFGMYGDQDDAQRKLHEAKGAFDNMNRMDSNCIQAVKAFKFMVDAIGGPFANLNPIARVAVGLLTKGAQIIIDQYSRDESVSDLLPKIQEVFEFLVSRDTLEYIDADSKACILVQLGQVVNNCAEFVTKYSARRNIATRLGKHFCLDTQSDIDEFNQRMDALMQRYRDRALQSTHVTVSRLSEGFKIDGMAYATGVGLIKTKACLEGTRREILAEIVSWIDDPDENVPRIFWLYGQAGKGKSAIAHTIAMWFKNVGRLGSCFCFA
ncbi:hypothetical protein ID866_11253, partial [Astraeus odoratus]